MAILVAQVGDIHLRSSHDAVFNYADKVGSAIAAEVTSATAHVVLVLSGDITYSGRPSEFEAAKDLIDVVEATIKGSVRRNVPIKIVLLPGNHDCDLSGDQEARNILLSAVDGKGRLARSIVDGLLKPLDAYFDFAGDAVPIRHSISREDPFFITLDICDSNSTLRLQLLNTAWMSSINETPGTLHFPLAEISPSSGRADYSIAALHHPTNWFKQPNAMRQLRDRLREIASLVLFNHEHTAETFQIQQIGGVDPTGEGVVYLFGGSLQPESENGTPSFNTLTIDFSSKRVAIVRHDLARPIHERPSSCCPQA